MAQNPKKVGGIVFPILFSVLVTTAISVGGLGAGYGIGILRYEVLGDPSQTQAQQGQAQQQYTNTAPQSGSAGPNVIVEAGTINSMSEPQIANGGSTDPGLEVLGSSQVSAPPVQEQLSDNNQSDVQETAQPQPPVDNSSATAPNQQPSTQPTGSGGNAAATKGGNSTSGNTQSGVNINPASPSGAKTQSGGTNSSNKSNGSWGEDSTTNEITGSLSRTAYWVGGGKSYHFSKSCPSLSRSTNINTGTLQDALNAGKNDPCNNCAGGS